MAEDATKYLDPKVLNSIGGLELQARLIVEGFMSGRHQSPYKGSSVEFAEHRQYMPGDDIRHIDWKVFGKSDRYYIKEYEEETNLKAYLVVDVSKSMEYRGGGPVSKLEYTKFAAASLLHVIQQQQDAGALVTFSDAVDSFVPPASSLSHFRAMMKILSEATPGGETSIGPIFHEVAERLRSRSVVMIFSDLLDSTPEIINGLNHMGHRGHDVIVFHVLDPDEISFPFERMTRFEGLESADRLLADPRALREAYLTEFQGFQAEVKSACLASRMDYQVMDTSRPLGVALATYLAQRAGRR